jgi:hypothetical protein
MMNSTDVKKRTGIWLDFREAYLIPLFDEIEGAPAIRHIESEIDTGATKGGIAPKVPYGAQGGVSEREMLDRRHHQEKHYFERILEAIDPATDELFFFGPAEAKLGLKKVIDQIKHYHPVVLEVRTTDKMTTNQMVAAVRQFFSVQ